MNLLDLIALLETLNIPLANYHFKDPQKPPFMIYIDDGTESFNADNIVYHEAQNIDIELYTINRDRALEKRIKELLSSADIPYDFSAVFIDSTKQYKITYEVTI